MARAIILTGNIASGKSSAVAMICAKTGYKKACIDDLRIALYREGMTGIALEREAEKQMMEMLNGDDLVYESTGTTLLYDRVVRHLLADGYQLTKIHVQTDADVCEYRFRVRKVDHFQVAPPYGGLTVKQSIKKNHAKYRMMAFDYVVNNNATKMHLAARINELPWKQVLK